MTDIVPTVFAEERILVPDVLYVRHRSTEEQNLHRRTAETAGRIKRRINSKKFQDRIMTKRQYVPLKNKRCRRATLTDNEA